MSNDLTVLAHHRDALLLAEVAAWLHMLGKLHEDFINGNHDMDTKVPEDIKHNFPDVDREVLDNGLPILPGESGSEDPVSERARPGNDSGSSSGFTPKDRAPDNIEHLHGLYTLLTNADAWNDHTGKNRILGKLPLNSILQAGNTAISGFMKRHRLTRFEVKKAPAFIKLINEAHGRGSNIEKGVLARLAPDQQGNVYLSTSLGYTYPHPIVPALIYALRQCLYDCLQTSLRDTQKLFKNLKDHKDQIALLDWMYLRSNFIRRLEQSFRVTVAETRYPLNDVTLFDQTSMTVAFFKAALAQIILTGQWKDPFPNKPEGIASSTPAYKYNWQLLRIGLDSFTFWGNSIRIGDLLARKTLITKALDEVQKLLEVRYPLGTEVYRDENCSVFIVPNIEKLLQYEDKENSISLDKQIQDIATMVFSSEARFTLDPFPATRGGLFGDLVAKNLPQPVPETDQIQHAWKDIRKDVCPVCGLRPQSPHDEEQELDRKICHVCKKRRVARSKGWIKEPSNTIWIDEVTDINGRIALVVGQFDIANWLSGRSFNTILAFDPSKRTITEKGKKDNKESYEFEQGLLISAIQEGLAGNQAFKDDLLGKLIPDKDQDKVLDFYNYYLSDTDLEDASSQPQPERLALALLRLPPSPARISRTWRTTQTFWREITTDLKVIIGSNCARRGIKGKFTDNEGKESTLGISRTYEIKLGNINVSIACTEKDKFVTVDNLRRATRLLGATKESASEATAGNYIRDELRKLQGVSLPIEEPTGYGSPNKVLGTLEIQTVSEGSSYIPAISILAEPRTFMAIIPADKALGVAKAIREKYEKEMGKVQNRLPLTLGIVFAERRTPLPAILDAGRRMLKQPTDSEPWTIDKVDPYPQKIELTMKKDKQTILVTVPTVMGDGETKDVWYPYWQVNNVARLSRTRQFTGVDGKQWVHIYDLQAHDEVCFRPSHFDFEFLDTAARRFEVSYANGKRRGLQHPSRPYYLEQLESFERLWNRLSSKTCGLTTSQIHNLIGIIETKRIEWAIDQKDASVQETFVRFVGEVLNDAEWKQRPSKDDMEQLHQAAISGQLADVVELYIRILKKDVEENS